MNRQDYHDDQKRGHHNLGYPLDSFLDSKQAYRKSNYAYEYRPESHHRHIAQHIRKSCRNFVRSSAGKFSPYAPVAIIHHPSAYSGIEHHQQITSDHSDPLCHMPAGSFRLQCLEARRHAVTAAASYRELAHQHWDSQNNQE